MVDINLFARDFTGTGEEGLMPTVFAFDWVPDFAKGYVRDLPVRWALEEAGISYEVRLISHGQKNAAAYCERQPFAQVPAYEDGDLCLFECGAIVLHLAATGSSLMPEDAGGKARVTSWVMSALNTLDPAIRTRRLIKDFDGAPAALLAKAEDLVQSRLAVIAKILAQREYLEHCFSVGDLMMAFIMRSLDDTSFVRGDPVLGPYLTRCLSRPAFKRALAAQLADFTGSPPQGA